MRRQKEVVLENLRQADSVAYGSHREGKPLSNSCAYTIRQAIQTAYNFVRDNCALAESQGVPDDAIEELCAELERRGIDTSAWDGEEGEIKAVGEGIQKAIGDAQSQAGGGVPSDPIVQVSGFGVANTNGTQCDYMLVGLTQSGQVVISRGDGDWADISPAAPTPAESEGGTHD